MWTGQDETDGTDGRAPTTGAESGLQRCGTVGHADPGTTVRSPIAVATRDDASVRAELTKHRQLAGDSSCETG